MKNFLSKIGRFFWSWGFLKFILWTLTLLVFLYVEENWRGARAWAATKAKWEAKGESFDPNTYYPKPVPDDQNLAALPIFALEPDPSYSALTLKVPKLGYLTPLKLNDSLNEEKHGGEIPRGNKPLDEKRAKIAEAFAKVFPGTNPPASSLAQFEALYPIIPEIRQDANVRPYCRFNQDYSVPVFNRSLGLITSPIQLSQKFALDATLAMAENHPEVALEDIRINFRFAVAVGRDPTLVGGLVDTGTVAITRGAIDNQLQNHTFTDPELVELQHELAQIDFLTQYKFSLRGEIITGTIISLDAAKINDPTDFPILMWLRVLPDGWLDLNKTKFVDFIFRKVASVDPKAHRVYPEIDKKLAKEMDNSQAMPWRFAPWNILYAIASQPISHALKKFAEIQVWLDEDQIVCALERYHLAHGTYPRTLDELAPAYIPALPHDIMNGEAYHYRLHPDGTFLLYSVGWNQTDDGGKVVYQAGSKTVNYEEGDWPWPTSK